MDKTLVEGTGIGGKRVTSREKDSRHQLKDFRSGVKGKEEEIAATFLTERKGFLCDEGGAEISSLSGLRVKGKKGGEPGLLSILRSPLPKRETGNVQGGHLSGGGNHERRNL